MHFLSRKVADHCVCDLTVSTATAANHAVVLAYYGIVWYFKVFLDQSWSSYLALLFWEKCLPILSFFSVLFFYLATGRCFLIYQDFSIVILSHSLLLGPARQSQKKILGSRWYMEKARGSVLVKQKLLLLNFHLLFFNAVDMTKPKQQVMRLSLFPGSSFSNHWCHAWLWWPWFGCLQQQHCHQTFSDSHTRGKWHVRK